MSPVKVTSAVISPPNNVSAIVIELISKSPGFVTVNMYVTKSPATIQSFPLALTADFTTFNPAKPSIVI